MLVPEGLLGGHRLMSKQEISGNIGEVFRQRRAEINLSLKEVENATSIRMAYLQAIEEGGIGKLISPVYAKGFVKQYAAFLGLDGDRILREHPQIFRPSEKQEFHYGIGTLEVRHTPGAGVKWLPNLMWAGLTVVTLVGGWYLARYLGLI
jgi:cytoskeletal protein RodZ